MSATKIEWCDVSWNPVTGCSPVSVGCNRCYARRMASRLRGRFGYPADDPFKVTPHPDKLREPLHWRKPRRVFVCSMGDLFHKDVPDEYITKVLAIAAFSPQHTFLFLTKRAERLPDYFQCLNHLRRGYIHEHMGYLSTVLREIVGERVSARLWDEAVAHYHGSESATSIGDATAWPWPLPNVHLGVSISNQPDADKMLPYLLQTPAAVRFVSYEPALGPVDFNAVPRTDNAYLRQRGETGCIADPSEPDDYVWSLKDPDMGGIGWIICGAETGPGARPMDLDWARSVRDQCAEAGVPFFFKRDSAGNRKLDGKLWEEYPA